MRRHGAACCRVSCALVFDETTDAVTQFMSSEAELI